MERSTKWRSHLTSPFFRVTVVTVTLFPRGYPTGILASDRRSLTKHPLRNLLLIFGGWELCSRPPKMSKGTERDQEKFFSRGLPSKKQNSTNTKKQTMLTQKHCLFFCLSFYQISAMTSTSTRTSFGSSFAATQLRAGFEVKYSP